MLNVLTISGSVFWRGFLGFRSSDVVIVVTNPPTLPFVAALASRLRNAQCLLLIHDVYPEVLIAAGVTSPDALVTRFIRWVTGHLLRSVKRVIVLGRDMREVVLRHHPEAGRNILIIPNWADVDTIRPMPRGENPLLRELGLDGRFVILYAGNMGRTHGLEGLIDAAALLQGRSAAHFLFIGSGAKKQWVEREARDRALTNVTVLANRPREDQINFLNACDVSIISFVPGMAGISVPSRMYNILAAGKPILAVADPTSELALLVREEQVGWVVEPAHPEEIVRVLQTAEHNGALLSEMGGRARQVAEQKYSLERVIRAYSSVIEGLEREKSPSARM